MVKITVYGLVLTLKNLGIWLSQYTIAGINVDKPAFMYALLIYAFVSIPTDLLLLNHLSEQQKTEGQKEGEE